MSATPQDNLSCTVEEVAAILRVSTWTVYRLVAANQIPHRRVGRGNRAIRFSREKILAWLGGETVAKEKKR